MGRAAWERLGEKGWGVGGGGGGEEELGKGDIYEVKYYVSSTY